MSRKVTKILGEKVLFYRIFSPPHKKCLFYVIICNNISPVVNGLSDERTGNYSNFRASETEIFTPSL